MTTETSAVLPSSSPVTPPVAFHFHLLHLHLPTNHPLLQSFLSQLGPLVEALLPILVKAAVSGSLGSTTPVAKSS